MSGDADRGKRVGEVWLVLTALAVAALTEALADPNWRIRENAAAALAAFGSRAEQAIPMLSKALREEPDSFVRRTIARAIFSIVISTHRADAGTAESLVKGMKDSNRYVRVQAASALVEIGQAEAAIPTLVESLRSQDHWSRGDAIWALEEAGPSARSALPALMAMVNEPEEQGGPIMKFQRVQAAKLLHQLGKTDLALRILRRSAQDEDLTTSQEARKVLMVVNPNETLNDEHKESR